MTDGIVINLKSILVLLSSLVNVVNDKQNDSADREPPWRILQFMLILSDIIASLVCFRNKLVFRTLLMYTAFIIQDLRMLFNNLSMPC